MMEKLLSHLNRRGFTIVELMVTILIVAVLAATLGVFFVNLLTLQEQEREEAYIRENLLEIVGNLADNMSVGSFITNRCDVTYRQDGMGVSLETGRVFRVTQLHLRTVEDTAQESQGKRIHFNVSKIKDGEVCANEYSHTFCGEDTPLIALTQLKELEIIDGKIDISCSLKPIYVESGDDDDKDAALWQLTVMAEYGVKSRKGKETWKTMSGNWSGRGEREDPVSIERVVRLWNHE